MGKYPNIPKVGQDMREEVFDEIIADIAEIKKLAVDGEISIEAIKNYSRSKRKNEKR